MASDLEERFLARPSTSKVEFVLCTPLMKCVTCTLVVLAAFILTMLVVVKITGGPSDRDPPPPSTQPPPPWEGKGGIQ